MIHNMHKIQKAAQAMVEEELEERRNDGQSGVRSSQVFIWIVLLLLTLCAICVLAAVSASLLL